jgi:hypothetical protein
MAIQMLSALKLSDFVGVWQRQSIAVAGGEPFEDSHVFWLQAGDYFADIRWPISDESGVPVSAFAGKVQWNAPRMRFVHEVDLTKEFTEDVGTLTLTDGRLSEKGKVTVDGKDIHFEEVWTRLLQPKQADCQVAARIHLQESGYIVRVGNFAIALQETDSRFTGACWSGVGVDGEWALLFGLGDTEELAGVIRTIISGSQADGWQVLL